MTNGFWDNYAAAGYDQLNLILPYVEMQQAILAVVAPQAGEIFLIAGCGTGNFEQVAMQRNPDLQIIGVDFSEQMLAIARKKSADNPLVQYQLHDLCTPLPFASAYFDGVVMCNVFYALSDREHALSEIARVLKPAGRLVLCDRYPEAKLSAVAFTHLKQVARLPWAARLHHLAREMQSLPKFLHILWRNLHIHRRERAGHFRLYSVEQVTALLRTMRMVVTSAQTVYAQQCWLLQVSKLAEPE